MIADRLLSHMYAIIQDRIRCYRVWQHRILSRILIYREPHLISRSEWQDQV